MLGLLKYSDDFSRDQGLNQLLKKDTTAGLADNTGFNARQSYLIASPTAKGTFSFRVPLKHIFGFCEDYDKISGVFRISERGPIRRGSGVRGRGPSPEKKMIFTSF